MPRRWLFRVVAAAYPPAIRRAAPDDIVTSIERAWRRTTDGRSWIAWPVASMRLLADLWQSWLGSRAERRWMAAHGSGSGPAGRARFPGSAGRDVAHAIRAFRGARGFYGGVILTLALGIGANAAVFSLVAAVVLQPLPYDRQDELVMLWRSPVLPNESWRSAITPRYLLAWREHANDLLTIAGVRGVGSLDAQMDFETPAGLERLRGALVTSNVFDVLGARALHGRLFTDADEAAGGNPVVISHSLWQRAFSADPQAIGRTVTLTTGRARARRPRTFTIVGVLPAPFRFTYPDEIEVWTMHPWTAIAGDEPDAIQFQVVGRLRPGVSFEHAQDRLAALHDVIRPERANLPLEFRQTTRLERIHDWVVGETRPTMILLSAVAVLLLVMACATTANALFIRVSERVRELALRTALGASRFRLVRQLLAEGLVLSTAGTVTGLALAVAVLPLLRALVPPAVPRADEIGVDAGIFGFAAGAVLVVTLLSAVVPAWRGARLGISASLKRSAGSASADRLSSRWRRGLVALQATIAATLLVLCCLLLVSFWRLLTVPLGFDPGNLIAVETRVIGADLLDANRLRVVQEGIVTRVRALPGVGAVAATSAVPFRGVDWRVNVDVSEGRSVGANQRHVDPSYFELLRMRAIRGRLLTDEDLQGAPPVAVVSESFAREAYGTVEVVGRTFGEETLTQIVGVVGDVRYATLRPIPALAKAIYVPRTQRPSELICLLVRPLPGVRDLAPAIRQAVRETDPTLPATGITSIASILDGTLAERRFYTATVATFAVLAVVLTIAGLVVVVVRAVVERRKEMAIRAALGASTGRLRARVVGEGLFPVAVGVVIGLALAWSGARWLAPFLFEVPARDSTIYVSVGAALLLFAAFAGAIAGRRSASVSPSVALRD